MYALVDSGAQYGFPETLSRDPVDQAVHAIEQNPLRKPTFDTFMWHTIGEPGNDLKQPELSQLYDVEPYTITQPLLTHGNHEKLVYVGSKDRFVPDVNEYYFVASADLDAAEITQWSVVGADYITDNAMNSRGEIKAMRLRVCQYALFPTIGHNALRPYRPKTYKKAEIHMPISSEMPPMFVTEEGRSPLAHLRPLYDGMKRYHEMRREESDELALQAARRHTMRLVTQ